MASPAQRTRDNRTLISRVPYLPGLDGMRALAVVAVMVYHANSDWLHGGFLGVEVFFIISGYLITLLLIAEHEKSDTVSLGQFWLRRARRLLPALFTMMIALAVYCSLFARDELGKLRGDVLAGTVYVSNWYQIWIGAGYTKQNEMAPLRHLWSLAVEEQFYVFWPLVMVAVLRLGRRKLPVVGLWLFGVALAITAAVAVLYHPGSIGECDATPEAYFQIAGRCMSKMDTLYLSTPTRMSGILLGAGMAMWWRPVALVRGPMRTKGRLLDGGALVGLAVLAGLMWVIHLSEVETDAGQVAGRLLFQGGFLLTGLATLAVIAAVTHPRAIMGKLLGNPVLNWVGTRSYGLYLYHWPIYEIIRKEAGIKLDVAQFGIAMVATVVITEASFRYIETPVRKGAIGRALKGLGTQTAEAADRRRKYLAAGIVGAILPVFAGVQLATAELKQNEVAQGLEDNKDDVTDIDDLLGEDTVPTGSLPQTTDSTAVPTSEPGTTQPGDSAPPTTKKPPKTTPTTEKPSTIDVLALGDSVMLGAATELANRGATVNAEQNRQGTKGAEILELLDAADRLGNVVIIHMGTNGPASTGTYERMMTATKDVPLVLMLTIRADRDWVPGNNAIIGGLSSTHANVKVLDWASLSNSCPGDCFYSDGIHLKSAGQRYYATLIWEAIGRG